MYKLLIILTLIPTLTFSQQWKMQTPLKVGDLCTDAFVINDTTAYTTTLNGKLFKTIDAGNHWTEAHHILGYQINGTVWGIHFTDVNNGVIPTGTGRIFRTNDAGVNWIEEYFDNTKILYEVYFPSTDTGYVCGYPGTVLKTIDGGQNWNFISTGTTQELRDVWFTSNDTGCIVSDQGDIIKTVNGGQSWVTVYSGSPALWDIEFIDANTGFVAGSSGTILKTSDGGDNWTLMTSGVTKRLSTVHFISTSEIIVSGDDGTILRSLNGGINFTSEGPGGFDDIWGMALFNNGTSVAVGDGVVYQLNTSGQWEMKYDEIPEAFFDRVIFTSSDTGHAVGHYENGLGARAGIIKTNNKGKLWTTTFSSATQSANLYDLSFVSSNIGFAGSNPSIRTTTNGGNSNWGSVTGPSGSNTAIHFFNQDTGLVSCYQGIYKTTNGGSTWNLVMNTGTPGFQQRFWFIDKDTGYVCGTDVLKTTNGGNSWVFLNVPLGGTLRALHFPNDSVGYVVGDNGGLKTEDYGANWSSISNGINGARDVFFPDPANPDSGYVLLFNGTVKKTIDAGQNWSTVIQAPWDKEFDSFWFSGNMLYAGGSWGDIFVANISQKPPTADFIADFTTIPVGTTVNFTDLSTNSPTSWQWSFPGSNQNNSIQQHPNSVQYDTLGCYKVTLKAYNEFGGDTITKTCYIDVVPHVFCNPNPSSGTTDGDFVDGVSIGSINNLNTGSPTGPNYVDYTSLNTTITRNGNFSLSIIGGSYFPDTYAAWIDYNHDGIFDTGEKLGEFSSSTAYQTQSINFTVPLTATLDTTRMRIRCVYGNFNIDACTDYIFGETEDYTVIVNPISTSINIIEKPDNIKLYPNPTSDIIQIITTEKINSVTIMDMTGRTIKEIHNKKTIQMGQLPQGMYYLKINLKNHSTLKKVIKN